MPSPITDKLKKDIKKYLKTHSQYQTAKHFGVGQATVNRIFNSTPGLRESAERSKTKNATEARMEYSKTDRLRVLNKFMRLIDTVMDSGELSTLDLRNISTALGTALDKYRLEEKDMDDTSKGEALDLLTKLREADARAA